MQPRRRAGTTTALGLAVTTLAGCAGLTGAAEADEAQGATAPPDPRVLERRAEYYQVALEHVLTVEGYVPAAGGAGPYAADGYAAVLVEQGTGSVVMLSVLPGGIDASTCPAEPVLTTGGSLAEGPVECVADGAMFDRTAGTWREYAVERDGAVVRVSGEGTDGEVLRAAIEGVRTPTASELDSLLPPLAGESPSPSPGQSDGRPPADGSLERGDLPPGDGAPDNSVGLGG